MEETAQPTTKTQKNNWKSLAIALIVVSVLLAGAVAFFAVRSLNDNSEVAINSEQNTEQQDSEEEKCADEVAIAPDVDEADYLVVSEWNIRFRKPVGFTEISFTINDNRLDFSGHLDGRYMVDAGMPTEYGLRFISAMDNFSYLIRYPVDNNPCKEYNPTCTSRLVSFGGFDYYFIPPSGNIKYSVTREEHLVFTAAYLLTYMAAHMEAI